MIRLIMKGVQSLFENGFATTWSKVKRKLFPAKYWRKPLFRMEDLDIQRQTHFSEELLFSIIVPLYNTPERFLREMVESVRSQTYGCWELCLANGSNEKNNHVGAICQEYARTDNRIRYKKLDRNYGISGNTTACIEMASGAYIALLDHDDLLHPSALFELRKAIEETGADMLYTDEATFRKNLHKTYYPHHKPDYAPDTLRSYNYIRHFLVFQRNLLEKAGGFRKEFDGSQNYDLILRLTEQANTITHIPKILYCCRIHPGFVPSGTSAKQYATNAAKRAISEHLKRVELKGTVEDADNAATYRIRYALRDMPLISILIPNCDHISDLSKCLNSIQDLTTYQNWEIIVIENNSRETETFEYYQNICQDPRIRVIHWAREFNYSAINNFGAQYANGEYILLLNNDIEIITPDWIEQLLMYAQRKDVGAVGAMLYYPNDTIQHAGVIVGIGGVAGHSHKHLARGKAGYMSRAAIAQNLSCVTGACILLRRCVWDQVNGLDEAFAVAFNDVDFCMRIRMAGYLVVWTPYAQMYHYESKSRGHDDTKEKRERFNREIALFQTRWKDALDAGDPYYNPNLTLEREDFSFK